MLEDRVAPCPQQLTGNVHRDKYRGKKFQPQIRLIKDKNGTILPENEDIKLRWKEFCVACTQKLFYLSFFAPCKGIRIPESRNFLLVESGILGFGIRNPALGIRNPTKDWNPESNLLKIHSWLDWATRSKEEPSMESLPRVYASTWWHTV